MAPSDASWWQGNTLYSVGDWHVSPGSGVFAKGDIRPAATPILLAPLSVLTEDSRTRAFAAGLTADLRHELAQQPSFMVVHSGVDGLAPALILGGNVRIYQEQARVNLQLIETHTYSLLWSSSFDVKLQSPLQAQALIAKRVSIEINKAA